jgi:putative flippase GtrA
MNVVKWNGHLLSDEAGRMLIERFPAVFQFATGPDKAFNPIAVFLGASVAMFNSFLLNRSFTFRVKSDGEEGSKKGKQLARVYMVGYIGMGLTVVISSGLYNVIPGHKKISQFVSAVVAAAVVATWNFVGQRYFAFQVHKTEK